MADDNSARYRLNDPYGRGPASAGPASDPLAELARLIGQNEPASEYRRERRLPVPPESSTRQGADPAIPVPGYDNKPAPLPSVEPAPQYSPVPRRGAETPRDYDNYPPAHNDWPGSLPTPAYTPPPPTPAYAPPPQDLFALPRHQPAPAARAYDNQGYVSPVFPNPNYPNPVHPNPVHPNPVHPNPVHPAPAHLTPNYPTPNFPSHLFANPPGRPGESYPADQPGFDAAGYPTPGQGHAPPLYPHEPEAGGMPPPHDDEFYDDVPSGTRRKGLLTVVAVLALAVVGTAGAVGYRSLFGGASSSGPPPVIRASGEPSKVAPPPQNVEQSVSKFSYDRFGDAGKDEQVVRREEKPVDLSKATPPRTVFPGAPVANAPPAKSGAGPGAGAAVATNNAPSAIGEPRRVRTVPIRPDQPDAATASSAAQAEPMSVAPPRQANAVPLSPPASRPADPAAAASARASSRPAPRPAPARDANAPLSLSPDANNDPLPAPATAPPRVAAPPSRAASAPASGGGSYLVQVSSQRSEADAETAYRGIQSKFSGVLGSQPHTVRRADLGAKGVYYRAMVGPFGSREEAVQLCSSLKQAGGDCVVQH